ncbi:DNA translocase FtsK 4TM domain-containing protein [Nocardia shimofusensis]|uniref:DNA translocase FtsK 4TM domain-containing protein n=1 Tax=Nocardia shimofusensis TaxID=228596 RepID=UPI0008377646|nr:DNA translocase FtsK 4TM domain-containing protein [Nocardia shimofusensis]
MTYPPQYGHPYASYGPPPQDHPQATTVLVLGILGLVLCQLCAPFAWFMGKRVLDEIDASGGAIGGQGSAKAGYICGIIGTILLLLYVLAIVLMVVLVLIGAISSSGSTY